MIPLVEREYLALLKAVYQTGEDRIDRTGVGTRELYDVSLHVRPEDCFPRMSHRFFPFKATRVETCWLLQGRSDINYLHRYGVHIWDSWVKEDGTLGPVYGVQLRRGIDQLKQVAFALKDHPESRRLYWTMWNPEDLAQMALPPCHHSAQFYVRHLFTTEATLDMTMFQRSGDLILGVPADIQMYALIHRLMARWAGYKLGTLTIHLGATHIYNNLIDTAGAILDREEDYYSWWGTHQPNPQLVIRKEASLEPWSATPEDFSITGYTSFQRLDLANLVAV